MATRMKNIDSPPNTLRATIFHLLFEAITLKPIYLFILPIQNDNGP